MLGVLAAPPPSLAQAPGRVVRIGFLGTDPGQAVYHGFRRGLQDLGWIEGRHFVIEPRWEEGRAERLPALAAELVRLSLDIIVAAGPHRIRAVQGATSTIPIVMAVSHEPVAFGLIAGFARPGGNTTGLAFQDSELSTKRLQLLKETLPRASRVAVLWHPEGGGAGALRATEEAAAALGLKLQILEVRDSSGLERAFELARRERAQALIQLAAPFFNAHRRMVADLAIRTRLPATCEQRALVEAGCLMAYGPSFFDMGRRAAAYVDRISKGAKPADLPVEQTSKFELLINSRTAKTLGITIPRDVLARADEVIE